MCLGVPAQVTGADPANPSLVRVEVAGAVRTVNRDLLDGPLEAGEWVVLHLGFALERISAADARDALALLADLSDP